jgi:magnesium and cobalt transporter
MSSTPDPSSFAAHGAQEDDHMFPSPKPGLLARLLGIGIAPDGAAQSDADDISRKTSDAIGLSNLRHMRVEDVAVPRAEIESVASDASLDSLVHLFRQSGLTRLPVFDGNLDNPIGLIHLKDVALQYGFNGGSDGFSLTSMVRPLLYVPPSMPIGVLLTKMQAERMHMALVIDEYGGVDGLVTIEDLIEQVVGEIEDEHDIAEAALWSKESPLSYLALARAPLDEFETEIGLSLIDKDEEEEVDTLGGLVFLLSGHVPARGEVVAHPAGVEFEVIDADARRIKRLRVRMPKPGE